MTPLLPLDDERSLNIAQFCHVEGLQDWEFWELVKKGLAPAILSGPANFRLITPQARLDWHRTLPAKLEEFCMHRNREIEADRRVWARKLRRREKARLKARTRK
jgi:hypothetical protein